MGIKSIVRDKFTPFNLNLRIETFDEALTFFHLFNRSNIDSLIKYQNFYGDETSKDVRLDPEYVGALSSLDNFNEQTIAKELNAQGLSTQVSGHLEYPSELLRDS